MSAKVNGGESPRPALHVSWDEQSQTVALQFDPNEFRSWDFVVACLEMAKMQADLARRVAITNNMVRGPGVVAAPPGWNPT